MLQTPLIGLFGGTFDPVHLGHLRMAEEVLEVTGMAELRFIPARVPPHRPQPGASPLDRLQMLEAALIGADPRMKIDARELERPGLSYSYETLREIRQETGPESPIALILGADAFLGFESWFRWREITDLAHLIVITRPGYDPVWPDALRQLFKDLETRKLSLLTDEPHGRVLFLALTPLTISASAIRTLILQGRSARYLTPDAVLEKIKAEGLYRQDQIPKRPGQRKTEISGCDHRKPY